MHEGFDSRSQQRITQPSGSTAQRQAQKSAAPKACRSSLGSANVADPPMLREHAQPEQLQPPQQQHRRLSHRLHYAFVSVERKLSS